MGNAVKGSKILTYYHAHSSQLACCFKNIDVALEALRRNGMHCCSVFIEDRGNVSILYAFACFTW